MYFILSIAVILFWLSGVCIGYTAARSGLRKRLESRIQLIKAVGPVDNVTLWSGEVRGLREAAKIAGSKLFRSA